MPFEFDKAIKFHSKYGKYLHWVVFLLFAFIVVQRMGKIDWTIADYDFSTWSVVLILLSMSLVYFNWLLEFQKWSISLSERTNSKQKRMAFYAGMVSGFVTPSYFGNFIGRTIQFKEIRKRQIISLTMVSNLSQFASTVLFGSIGLMMIRQLLFPELSFIWVFSILVFVLLGIVCFVFFDRINLFKMGLLKQDLDAGNARIRFKMMVLSTLRHLVFSIQFFLVFMAFSEQVGLNHFWGVCVMYLLMSVSPSIVSGKLLIRESIAVFVFSALGEPVSTIVLVALLIWLINNVLPTAFAFIKLKRHVA